MAGNDFVWIASIIVGLTLVGWLVLDWLESAQRWESFDADATSNAPLGHSEGARPDALDVETELMLCYPLDPFAPALLWRPQPQDEWVETQEGGADQVMATRAVEPSPAARPSEAS